MTDNTPADSATPLFADQLPAEPSNDDSLLFGDIRFGFHIGSLNLLLKQHIYSELIDMPEYSILPNTPKWIIGVSNLRGSIYPIFDLHTLLGIKKPSSRDLKIFIVDKGEGMLGIPIDLPPKSIKNITLQHDAKIPSETPEALSDFISDIYSEGSNGWLEFDHINFFTSLSKNIDS